MNFRALYPHRLVRFARKFKRLAFKNANFLSIFWSSKHKCQSCKNAVPLCIPRPFMEQITIHLMLWSDVFTYLQLSQKTDFDSLLRRSSLRNSISMNDCNKTRLAIPYQICKKQFIMPTNWFTLPNRMQKLKRWIIYYFSQTSHLKVETWELGCWVAQ